MKISLRVLFMVFVGLAVAIVFGISFGPLLAQNMHTANIMGQELVDVEKQSAFNAVDSFIREFTQLTRNLVHVVEFADPVYDEFKLKHLFINLTDTYASRGLSYLHIGFENGYFWGLENTKDESTGDLTYTWRVINDSYSERTEFQIDRESPEKLEVATGVVRVGYDPRKRSWYKATNTSYVSATKAYATTTGVGLAAITFGAHLRRPDGTVFGVSSLDITTKSLTQILSSIHYGHTGAAVLIEIATGSIIGISTDEQVVLSRTETGNANLLKVSLKHITDVETPILRDMVAELKDEITTTDPVTLNVIRGGMWLTIKEHRDIPGLELRFAVAIPREDYLGAIHRSRNVSIAASVVTLVLVLCVMFVMTWMLTKPLIRLGENMHLTASLVIMDDAAPTSWVSEIYAMQHAYSVMNAQIARAKAFMPLSLLLGDDDDEEEDEDVASSAVSEERHRSKNACNIQSLSGSSRSSAMNSFLASQMASSGMDTHGSSALNSKNITIACLNVELFHPVVMENQKNVARSIEIITDIVTAAAADFRGVVDNIIGDHFFVSFNASRPCASHGSKAVHFAVRAKNMLLHENLLHFCGYTIAIASGSAIVGSVGNASIKRFSIMGPVYNKSLQLAKAGSHFNRQHRASNDTSVEVTILAADASVKDVVDAEYHWVGRGYVTTSRGRIPYGICLVRGLKNFEEEEWMYQLEQSNEESNGAFDIVNDAFVSAFKLPTRDAPLPCDDYPAALRVLIDKCDASVAATPTEGNKKLQQQKKDAALNMLSILAGVSEGVDKTAAPAAADYISPFIPQ